MSTPVVYFESTNRKGVRLRVMKYVKGMVHLKDADGQQFELPANILRERNYKLVKENGDAKPTGV